MSSLPNILIVDDNSTNLIYLEIILRDIKANLIQASSGFDALDATRGVDLSLAILDVQMPLMNGYELAVRLNEERIEDKVPIIFLTAAYPNSAKILEGYEAGAVDYIIKPLNKVILISKINIFLEIYHQKQRVIEQADKLRISELELLQAKQQLEMVNLHLTEAREEERAAISMKVHDELGQAMTALKMDLNWVKQNMSNTEPAERKLDKMIAMTNDVIRRVQRISSELHPVMLDDLGLMSAIEWFCEDFEERTGIKCSLSLEDVSPRDPSVNLALFRILQEAMTNVIRHAQATSVNIQLMTSGHEIVLTIADNGIGLPEDRLESGRSFGIISMRQRAQQCGGTIDIAGIPGAGTSIVIRMPLN